MAARINQNEPEAFASKSLPSLSESFTNNIQGYQSMDVSIPEKS